MLKQLKLNFGYIAIVAFICFYPLDTIKYISSNFIFFPPFGLIGFLTGIALIPKFITIQRPLKNYYSYAIIFILVVIIFILITTSRFFEWNDTWIFLRLFIITPLIGYFLMSFFYEKQNNLEYLKTVSVGILLVLGLFILFFYFKKYNLPKMNYLRLAESVALSGLLALGLNHNKNILYKLSIVMVSLFILFLTDSRFALFSFIAVVSFYFFISSKKWFLLLIISLAGCLALVNFYFPEIIHQSRFYRLIFNTSNDTSLNQRSFLLSKGMEVLEEKPLLGLFGYHRIDCEGCYVHNFMSYWFEFGVSGLLFFAINSFIILRLNIKKWWFEKNLKESDYIFILLSMYTLIGAFFAKHWEYKTFYLIIGAAYYIMDNRKRFIHSNKI